MAFVYPSSVALRMALTDYESAVLADAPAAFWRLGDKSGAAALDDSGNARAGTYAAGTTLWQTPAVCDNDPAVLFDGISGAMSVADASWLHASAFSVELWVKPVALAGILASRWTASGNQRSWTLVLNGDGTLSWSTASDGASGTVVTRTTAAALSVGSWAHVVVTQTGSTVVVYINGAAVSTTGSAVAVFTTSTSSFYLARDGAGSFFSGAIDEAAFYSSVLSGARVLAHYTAGQWTDVTTDLTDEDIVLDYGIKSNDPRNRTSPTGALSFGMRNDNQNSAATLGLYSPYSASRRSGFTFGVRVQLAVAYSGTTYYWLGRLRTIDAVPDQYGSRVTHCVAVDWMDEAARANAQVTIQQNQRSDQAFSALVACVPEQPALASVDVGIDTYKTAFDNVWQNAKVLSAFADLSRSEFGYIGQRRDTSVGQTVFFDNRHHRVLHSTLRATLNQTMHDLQVANSAADILNHAQVIVHPRRIDASIVVAAMQLTSASSPVSVDPGAAQDIWLDYTDPSQRSVRIGAVNTIAPVATTDYTMNSATDGSGSDLTGSFSVTASFFASSVKLTLTNGGSATGYVTKLQTRGDGVFTLTPVQAEAMDAASQAAYGDNVVSLDLLFQSDTLFGQQLADYVASQFSAPLANVRSVTFEANQSDTLFTAALAGDLGDIVEMAEAVSGLTTAQGFYIQSVRHSISVRNVIQCTWQLAPADTGAYWVLGTSTLGDDTVLGL